MKRGRPKKVATKGSEPASDPSTTSAVVSKADESAIPDTVNPELTEDTTKVVHYTIRKLYVGLITSSSSYCLSEKKLAIFPFIFNRGKSTG